MHTQKDTCTDSNRSPIPVEVRYREGWIALVGGRVVAGGWSRAEALADAEDKADRLDDVVVAPATERLTLLAIDGIDPVVTIRPPGEPVDLVVAHAPAGTFWEADELEFYVDASLGVWLIARGGGYLEAPEPVSLVRPWADYLPRDAADEDTLDAARLCELARAAEDPAVAP